MNKKQFYGRAIRFPGISRLLQLSQEKGELRLLAAEVCRAIPNLPQPSGSQKSRHFEDPLKIKWLDVPTKRSGSLKPVFSHTAARLEIDLGDQAWCVQGSRVSRDVGDMASCGGSVV